MSRQIRRVAGVMFVLFGALFVNLNYIQVIRAADLADNPLNRRQILREYGIKRGLIVVGSGTQEREIALSVETTDELRYLRQYPEGELWAHITGYYSFLFGRAQMEQEFNSALLGRDSTQFERILGNLLDGRERPGDNLITSLQADVQRTAREALGPRKGAVAALNPQTGEVLALWSYPSYDPNALSSHDLGATQTAWQRLSTSTEKTLRNRATQELYPPGSTFKLVTAAAALEQGMSPATTFADPTVADIPQTTADIGNFGGGTCNGGNAITLAQALVVSCNTTFAQLGLMLGADALVAQAERFGLNREWEFQLPYVPSRIPKELDPPATAQSAIGQRDVQVTPLEMAMIAGTIGNDGLVMTPRVVNRVQDFAGRSVRQFPARPLELSGGSPQALSPQNARLLQDMMVGVVERGTGRGAAIPGVTVAGKTGTAQTGEGRAPTVWFVGFAPADNPRVAVAVVVENGGGVGDEATGGRLAAPIARAVMEAALAATEGE
ncbi:MAG: peptidoglycan D,D-transpeptidase FtsI family protein [Egibacteraceae bacterium]